MEDPNVVIIGAGLAGLACALTLQEHGIPSEILEAGESVGGRVQTDAVGGYLLDHGFQVFPTAYPLGRKWLHYGKLHLREFEPGASLWYGGRWHRFTDPTRRPLAVVQMAASGAGTLADKLRLRRWVREVRRGSWQLLFSGPDVSTAERLAQRRFSRRFQTRFLRPFFAGVLSDPALATSARMADFALRMFAQGAVAVPADGMGAIPRQMAARLPPTAIHLRSKVVGFQANRLLVEGGGAVLARQVVVATDGAVAAVLLGGKVEAPAFRSVTTFYFSTAGRLRMGRRLLLNGEGKGPVNHAAVMSEVAPRYAPPGRSLLSASVLDPGELSGAGLEAAVAHQLGRWLRVPPAQLEPVAVYDIRRAVPACPPGRMALINRDTRVLRRFYVAGDYCTTPSIQGALDAGRIAAEAVMEDLKQERGDLDWSA